MTGGAAAWRWEIGSGWVKCRLVSWLVRNDGLAANSRGLRGMIVLDLQRQRALSTQGIEHATQGVPLSWRHQRKAPTGSLSLQFSTADR
jgi:hypothetical protein